MYLLISNLSLPLAILCAVSFLLSCTPPFLHCPSVFAIADHLLTWWVTSGFIVFLSEQTLSLHIQEINLIWQALCHSLPLALSYQDALTSAAVSGYFQHPREPRKEWTLSSLSSSYSLPQWQRRYLLYLPSPDSKIQTADTVRSIREQGNNLSSFLIPKSIFHLFPTA